MAEVNAVREHILALLKEHGTIRYNEHFYRDGDPELWRDLCKKYGVEENEGGEDSPPVLVEVAVGFLMEEGLVETLNLPEKMGDGEPDYEIKLTEKGRQLLK